MNAQKGVIRRSKPLVMITQKDPRPHSLDSMLGPHVFHCSLAWRGPRLLCLCWPHSMLSPKAASWRILAYPNSPGEELREIDMSVWELDHKVL